MSHTPLPWRVSRWGVVNVDVAAERDGRPVALWASPEDAALIVAAVNERDRLLQEHRAMREELQNIVNANPREWDDFDKDDRDRQFRLWAQNRARHTLAGVTR